MQGHYKKINDNVEKHLQIQRIIKLVEDKSCTWTETLKNVIEFKNMEIGLGTYTKTNYMSQSPDLSVLFSNLMVLRTD